MNDTKIIKIGQKTGGFFIECGAFDGEVRSQTMFFELKRNWTGKLHVRKSHQMMVYCTEK